MKSTNRTPQLQFLSSIDSGGEDYRGVEYQDLHLSDHNHDKVRALPNVSPKRWVLGLDLKLEPGKGSGTIVIAGEYFNVVYAWGGRDKRVAGKPWDYADRTSYTVRLEGKGVRKAIQDIRDQIVKDECGALKYRSSYRKEQAKIGIKSSKDAVKAMEENTKAILKCKIDFGSEELRKMYRKLQSSLRKVPMKARLALVRKEWKQNRVIMMPHSMKPIETDMI